MGVKQALATPSFWLLSLVFGAQTMGTNALNIHLIPYFESIGFSTAQAVSVLGAFTLLSAIGRLGGGFAFDMWNSRLVMAAIMGCQVIAFFIMANVTAYWQIFPFALFWGIAFGGMIPARDTSSAPTSARGASGRYRASPRPSPCSEECWVPSSWVSSSI